MSHRFIQGGTVLLTFADDDAPLTGYTVTGAVKKGNFYAELTFEAVDMALGVYQFKATADETKHWPVGRLEFGLKYVVGDIVTFPEPFDIHIIERIVL